jgi:hypothetical protein
MSDRIIDLEGGVKLYRTQARAKQIVDMCVAHSLNEQGEPDEHNFRRFAHDVAALATTTLLRYIYDNDGEINRLAVERDHYKRLAEEGLRYQPIGPLIIASVDTDPEGRDTK